MESVAVGMALVGVDGRALHRVDRTPPQGRRADDAPDPRVLHDRAHDMVGRAHPKAMPVILRTGEERAGQRMSQELKSLMPRGVVELRGIEPLTSSLRTMRSPN